MPLHRIYAPAGLFSAQEKRQLANDLTDMYTAAVGLPPFLVITLFVPIDGEEDFFIGRQSHAEREKEQGKPFVRIVSQHLARTAIGKENRASMIKRLEDRFCGVLEAKNAEWEIHIEEPPADLWHLGGYDYPAPGTDAEKEWKAANKAIPYEGPTMADHLNSQSNL
ncbi:putative oxalocrotonate tautomerase [Kalmanozyma brasiliensis GHG001]|uniref:Tautomerase cis-CaaD-like domain-containing protein n=1 Tax=Kalmanozyma brasiliensis (strain GHG001) TaxID=1365824 RepID=V5GSN3_KALBG|nr:putative oxalocrotonate tautomerase [Kalmanozyma brasiliensis GHG001]EST08932.1 putative oxalocrotonate tautomerase [Kalmanozyma brasiliensis GHG001]